MRIRNQADLERENIRVAWSMAHRMTDAQFAELCLVSSRALGEGEGESEVLGSKFKVFGTVNLEPRTSNPCSSRIRGA